MLTLQIWTLKQVLFELRRCRRSVAVFSRIGGTVVSAVGPDEQAVPAAKH